MIWVGYREIAVADIIVRPEDEIPRRLFEPHVWALADSFDSATGGEPGNTPWVSEVWDGPGLLGYRLVAGRDRFAALLHKGVATLWVRVGDFDGPRDLLLAEVHENLHRRPEDRNALIARLVDRTVADGVSPPAGEELPKAGRPKSERQRAREQVAAEVGLTPKAVARADEKAAAAVVEREPGEDDGDEPAPLIADIDMRGLSASEDWIRGVNALAEQFETLERDARDMRGTVRGLEAAGLHGRHVEALKAALGRVLDELAQRKPHAVCRGCKDPDGSQKRREQCGVCLGKGYTVASQEADAVVPMKGAKGLIRNGDHAPAVPPAEAAKAAVREARPTSEEGGGARVSAVVPPGTDRAAPGVSASPANVGTWRRPPPRNRIVVVRDDGSEAAYDPTEAA